MSEEPKRVWNYRVLKSVDPNTGEEWFQMIEVYYDRPDGKPISYGEGPTFISDTAEGLKGVLEKHADAINKPFLTKEDFSK